ncbi:MAG: hypothetical protein HRF45_12875 [Fimbriimonadia bacterium]
MLIRRALPPSAPRVLWAKPVPYLRRAGWTRSVSHQALDGGRGTDEVRTDPEEDGSSIHRGDYDNVNCFTVRILGRVVVSSRDVGEVFRLEQARLVSSES